jgi:hypothetical protein
MLLMVFPSPSDSGVIRGGAGYYYQTPNTLVYQQTVGIPPFAPIVSLTDVNFTHPYQSAGVANPFPTEFGPSNPGPTASFPQDPALEPVFAQHFHLATTLTWNLTVERSLGQTVFSESDNSFSAIGEDRADLTGVNPVLSHGRSHAALVNAWCNTAAFQSNAIGTFGNSGKNFLRGPR